MAGLKLAIRTNGLPIVKAAPVGVQRCNHCGLFKYEESFYPSARMTSLNWNKSSTCRPCANIRGRKYTAIPENRVAKNESKRHQSRRSKYGLTETDFLAKIESQDGKCAICKTDSPGGAGTWHVDHSHKTGKVRGLLCSSCNRGIGYLKDDAEVLESAASYLKLWS